MDLQKDLNTLFPWEAVETTAVGPKTARHLLFRELSGDWRRTLSLVKLGQLSTMHMEPGTFRLVIKKKSGNHLGKRRAGAGGLGAEGLGLDEPFLSTSAKAGPAPSTTAEVSIFSVGCCER